MRRKIFITGTDTHVGKTLISVGLLKAFNRLDKKTIGLKPVASGCFYQDDQLYSQDALDLMQASSIKLDYANINPFAFIPPIAPHLAANQANLSLTVNHVLQKLNSAFSVPADVCIIEGVGGWFVPLNQHETMADMVKTAKWPVILVVAIRLGCLNHAILTKEAIWKMGVPILGWVANCLHPNENEIEAMIHTLTTWFPFPCLGRVPYQSTVEDHLDITSILDY